MWSVLYILTLITSVQSKGTRVHWQLEMIPSLPLSRSFGKNERSQRETDRQKLGLQLFICLLIASWAILAGTMDDKFPNVLRTDKDERRRKRRKIRKRGIIIIIKKMASLRRNRWRWWMCVWVCVCVCGCVIDSQSSVDLLPEYPQNHQSSS